MMTVNPARILGIDKGKLSVGGDGDITIIDPELKWRVDVDKFYSKSRNCPYDGWELTGRATNTIVGGVVKFELGE